MIKTLKNSFKALKNSNDVHQFTTHPEVSNTFDGKKRI